MKKVLKRYFYSASKQHGAKIHDGLKVEILYYLLFELRPLLINNQKLRLCYDLKENGS